MLWKISLQKSYEMNILNYYLLPDTEREAESEDVPTAFVAWQR